MLQHFEKQGNEFRRLPKITNLKLTGQEVYLTANFNKSETDRPRSLFNSEFQLNQIYFNNNLTLTASYRNYYANHRNCTGLNFCTYRSLFHPIDIGLWGEIKSNQSERNK